MFRSVNFYRDEQQFPNMVSSGESLVTPILLNKFGMECEGVELREEIKKPKLDNEFIALIILPNNVVQLIMSKLTPREITLYSRVNKHWNAAYKEFQWKQFYCSTWLCTDSTERAQGDWRKLAIERWYYDKGTLKSNTNSPIPAQAMNLKSSLENLLRKHTNDSDLAKSVNIKLNRWELITRSTNHLSAYVSNIVVQQNYYANLILRMMMNMMLLEKSNELHTLLL